MKRLFAILLLSVHLFYTGGYSLFFQYFIKQSESQIVKQIYENKVDATQLVQIKVPVKNKNGQNWADYKKLEGQVQLKGGYYNYVGVKMTKDTMYLVCVANSLKARLVSANLIVAKNMSDVPLNKKGADAQVKKAAAGYEYQLPASNYSYVAFSTTLKGYSNPISTKLTHPYIESPGKPPNFGA
ncbi:hypothetical protein [Mucilaginibacter pedocola]|uniref:Uncharacterized protein n=1 Tax=Mucilaginibacter pedocola TaxID=1792845 RepID=A0A1S9PMS9_9SPHI|nr:hypothetical protein [Mucilaginibacter pedocola]OOQ62231.1 hypothetical protein BC343_04090 [Mucilaginibacter pedocola]